MKPICKEDGRELTTPCIKTGCKYHIYDRNKPQSFTSRRTCGEVFNCAIIAADMNPDGIQLERIAMMLDISRERVRQIQDMALDRIKTGKKYSRSLKA